MTAGVLQVHSKTLPHLDLIEQVILDELVKTGRAVIVSEIEGIPGTARGDKMKELSQPGQGRPEKNWT